MGNIWAGNLATITMDAGNLAGDVNVGGGSQLNLSDTNQTAGGIEINLGEVGGVGLDHGSLGSIFGASVTSSIRMFPPSNLHLVQIVEPPGSGICVGSLNGNNLYLCGNATSNIDLNIAVTGLVTPVCAL